MNSQTTARMLGSLLLGLFLALLAVPRGAQSFVTQQQVTYRCHVIDNNLLSRIASTSSDDDLAGESSEAAATADDSPPPPPAVKCPNCDKCDGSGRIEGGIGTILTFWPIKAYRPCPNFIENGGFYTRSGQGLDEIAFGRDSKYDPMN